jgi:uncharacterized cupin superfamily protein
MGAMSDDQNVFEMSSWDHELGPARGARLGPRLGSSELGCSLYEVDPGAQAVPYHAHYANEELTIAAIEADPGS